MTIDPIKVQFQEVGSPRLMSESSQIERAVLNLNGAGGCSDSENAGFSVYSGFFAVGMCVALQVDRSQREILSILISQSDCLLSSLALLICLIFAWRIIIHPGKAGNPTTSR